MSKNIGKYIAMLYEANKGALVDCILSKDIQIKELKEQIIDMKEKRGSNDEN